ncbi:MAG TPA: tetratricopeptide repeat protein, partial [Planctomycetaceae bacterium]|nr:tetratricopeptide repeat protein [Planctomycetaceae bacterium]
MTGHRQHGLGGARLVIACLIGICGCASTSGPNRLAGHSHAPAGVERHEKSPDVKHPEKLHLAYAKLQEQLGNLAEARKSYEVVLGEKPKSVDAVLGLARLDQLAGRDHEAEQGFQRALDLAPNDPEVLDTVGQFFAGRKQWDRAVELLQQAVAASPADATIRQHLAIALAHRGDVPAALAHFTKTVGDAAAHYNVAVILYEEGQVDEAETHLLQAVIKKPDLHEAQVWLDEIRREREAERLAAGATPSPSEANAHGSLASRHGLPGGRTFQGAAGVAEGVPRRVRSDH